MPENAIGKVDRKALKALALDPFETRSTEIMSFPEPTLWWLAYVAIGACVGLLLPECWVSGEA